MPERKTPTTSVRKGTGRKAAPLNAELFAAKGRATAQTEQEAAAQGGEAGEAGQALPASSPAKGQEADQEPLSQPAASVSPLQIDGRRLRATGRTQRFGATVHPDWAAKLKHIAQRDGLLMVEVLERALEAYERDR